MRHRFHALCPYFAMFPEDFAAKWIDRLTKPDDVVLDPFCGRGTAPFQALLMDRQAVATDVNPVAYCITKAKTNSPSLKAVRGRLKHLANQFDRDQWEPSRRALPEFFRVAYDAGTLRQLLYLRTVLKWQTRDTDCMIAALVLGSLHGETDRSPSYFSNQMPHAISTKPAYSVRYWRQRGLRPPKRDVFRILGERATYRYASERPQTRATVFNTDMRELPRLRNRLPDDIGCAITSPPYLNVTSFEEDQWLRLWFLGNSPHPTYRSISKDDRHESPERYWGLIGDMWRSLGQVLSEGARVVVRFGARQLEPDQLVQMLEASTVFARRSVRLRSSEVSTIKRRQTATFRPGAIGCLFEIDCHFQLDC
jgi:hypothetical protein